MILEWLKAHVGVIFMGIAGATVTALMPSGKPLADRIIGWIVGVILCRAYCACASRHSDKHDCLALNTQQTTTSPLLQ